MKYVGLALLLAGGFLMGTLFFRAPACVADCGPQISSVSAAEFQQALSTAPGVLIDVRTSQEFSLGHLTGAVNADYSAPQSFQKFLDTLDKQSPYYIYCRSGNRSGQALELMRQNGFTHVINLSGGIVGWQSAGLPVVQ